MLTNDIYFRGFLIYLLFINILTFGLFAEDKKQSRKRARRIPERILLLNAFIGGSLGGLIGMYALRHKTRHLKFTLGIPLIILLQGFLLAWFFYF